MPDVPPPWEEDDEPGPGGPDLPALTVEITEPKVLAYLYGPDGAPIATLLDRPIVPFGFTGAQP